MRSTLTVLLSLMLLFLVRAPEASVDASEPDDAVEYLLIAGGESVVWESTEMAINGMLRIDGDLTLVDSDMYLWGNSSLEVNGNLSVTDGSLMASNGSFSFVTSGQGNIFIEDSTLDGIHLASGNLFIRNSTMINSTVLINRWDMVIDTLFRNGTSNNPNALVAFSESRASVTNITILDYPTAVSVIDGTFEMTGSLIRGCVNGIISSPGNPLIMRNSRIDGSERSISAPSSLNLRGSVITGGTVELQESSILSSHTEFIGVEGVSDAGSGMIRNSTFRDCVNGLSSPSDVSITGSAFIGCDVAINQPSEALIYHNSFIDNLEVVVGPISSSWFNSDLMEGNYYSGYRGLDDGTDGRFPGDGVGDTNIPYLGRDRYPLMKDRLWDMPRITELRADYIEGTGMVNLSWIDTGGDGILIQRSTSPDFDVDLVSWSVTGNEISIDNNPNSTLYFRVGVFNQFGYRGWSMMRTVSVDQIPLAPSSVSAEPLDEGSSLQLSWVQLGEDIKSVYVFIAPYGGRISTLELEHPVSEVIVGDLQNGVVYNISMINEDNAGQFSDPSQNISAVPEDRVPSPPPRSLRATARTNTTIDIYWDPPLIQDISRYLVYRQEDDGEMMLIANLSRFTFSYADTGLEDNTSYSYSMRTIDDDGPYSVFSETITVRTLHFNREPLFSGEYQYIPLVEDQEPLFIYVDDLVSDPDGDNVRLILQEYYRVKADLIDDKLWILPSEDQAGSGFVNLLASDGEVSTFFVIGVMIEEVPDPPVELSIVAPVNGSVLIPGSQILFQGEADDPDVPYGDNLTFRWTSDRDGPLNGHGTLSEHIYRQLTPGIHNITLTVSDSNGSSIEESVMVVVSLWGWQPSPWGVSVISNEIFTNGGKTRISIENLASIRLTFIIIPSDQETIFVSRERRISVPPSSTGEIDLDIRPPQSEGALLSLTWTVRAETMNGTFAGEQLITAESTVRRPPREEDGGELILILMIVSALLIVLAVIGVIVIGLGGKSSSVDENIEDKDSVPDDENGVENGR